MLLLKGDDIEKDCTHRKSNNLKSEQTNIMKWTSHVYISLINLI
jgi:hypothetical protein